MKRYLWVLSICLILCSPTGSTLPDARAAGATTRIPSATVKVDVNALRELLTKGLKVYRPDQEQYVNRVVALVASEKLPVSMVYAAFRYARRRRSQYPFPYFRYALETLAKRENIEI